MKNLTQKIISAVLAASLAGGISLSASATSVKYGDVNNSGSVDSSDALAVLEYSIGKTNLGDDAFTRADVNADGKVDSSDALDILRYSVELIDEFDVTVYSKKPTTKNEILAYYAKAIEKAKTEKPKYLLKTNSECVNADVTVKDPLGILKAAGTSAADMEKEMEDSMRESSGTTTTVVEQGGYKSYSNLPALCTLTDASKLKSITLTTLENGNYSIHIELNDAKNPSADNAVCQVMGAADYDSVLAELKNEADIEGAEGMVDISLDELTYKDLWITCEINPKNMQLVNCELNEGIYNVSTMKVMMVSVKTVVENTASCEYSSFTY